MLNKRQTSRILLKQSAHILKSNRQAIISPLLSNAIILLLLALILHPLIHEKAAKHFFEQAPLLKILLFYLYVLLFLFVTHIFAFFFMATLASHFFDCFDHKPTHFIHTTKTVCKRFIPLYCWFLYASFFGLSFVILEKLLQRLNWFKTLTQELHWKYAIYLVIPILLNTTIKTTDAIRLSSKLMSDTWGKSLKYNHSFTGYSLPLKLAAALPLLLAIIQGDHWLIVIGSTISVIFILLITSYFMSIRMIICCACYLHSKKQSPAGFFDPQAIASAFVQSTPKPM